MGRPSDYEGEIRLANELIDAKEGRERLSDEDLDYEAMLHQATLTWMSCDPEKSWGVVSRQAFEDAGIPALVAEIRELRRDSASNDALAALRGLVDALDQQNKGSGLVPAVLLARSEARRVLASYPEGDK